MADILWIPAYAGMTVVYFETHRWPAYGITGISEASTGRVGKPGLPTLRTSTPTARKELSAQKIIASRECASMTTTKQEKRAAHIK